MQLNITCIPGDGIGPEIVKEAKKVLESVASKYGHEMNFKDILMGGGKLATHPAFAEAYTKYNLDKAKKIKELSNRYSSLTRKGIELTDELLNTENFYLNM